MGIRREEVRKMAELARLHFTPEEMDAFIPRFEEIIDYVAQLKTVDTTRVEPLYHALATSDRGGADRADEIRPSLSPQEALGEAPDVVDQQFRVPRVIDLGEERGDGQGRPPHERTGISR